MCRVEPSPDKYIYETQFLHLWFREHCGTWEYKDYKNRIARKSKRLTVFFRNC